MRRELWANAFDNADAPRGGCPVKTNNAFMEFVMKKWLGKSIALTALIAAFVLSMAVGTVTASSADQEANVEQEQTMDSGQDQGATDEQAQPADEAPAQESSEDQDKSAE